MAKFSVNNSYYEKDGTVTTVDRLKSYSIYDFEGSFEDLIAFLQQESEAYYQGCIFVGETYHHIELETCRDYDSDCASLCVKGSRLVTGQELDDYYADKKKRELEREQRNRADYERLKAQFEKS